jgi:hypothetical protein
VAKKAPFSKPRVPFTLFLEHVIRWQCATALVQDPPESEGKFSCMKSHNFKSHAQHPKATNFAHDMALSGSPKMMCGHLVLCVDFNIARISIPGSDHSTDPPESGSSRA